MSHRSRLAGFIIDCQDEAADRGAAFWAAALGPRLERLGARRIGFVKRWCGMEAPTGHRFCIVRMREDAGRAEATVWE